MRVRRLSLAAAVAVLGALAFAASAPACSCAPLGPRQALRQADAAIVGRLVKVVPHGRFQADYRYRVQRVYKRQRGLGRRGRLVSVRSSSQPAACGLPRRTGRRYGLLLARGEGRWNGGLCGVIAPRRLRAAARQVSRRRAGSSGPDDCTS